MGKAKEVKTKSFFRPIDLPIEGRIILSERRFEDTQGHVLLEFPGKENTLKCYGHLHRFGDKKNHFNQHRYYLWGDLYPNSRPKESFIQVSVDESNQVIDCFLYRIHDEVFPMSEHEWDLWLNLDNGLLGNCEYTDASLKMGFQRIWEPEQKRRVEPWFYEEFQWNNEEVIGKIKKCYLVATQCMSYRHSLNDKAKNELALFVAVEEHIQDTSIKIYLGLKLDFEKDIKAIWP